MNKQIDNKQEISLVNRNKLSISGINKIDSLNDEQFIIDTIQGLLLVSGKNLVMQHLDIDKGQIWIEGKVNSLEYIEKQESKKEKQSFFGKLFK